MLRGSTKGKRRRGWSIRKSAMAASTLHRRKSVFSNLLFSTPLFLVILLARVVVVSADDQIIYSDDALGNGWQDWSWGSTIDYEATNIAEGTSSISVDSTAWAALSLKSPSTIGGFAGLRFDISVCCIFISRKLGWSMSHLLHRHDFFCFPGPCFRKLLENGKLGRSTGTPVLYSEHDG